jgi:hypothetical protein
MLPLAFSYSGGRSATNRKSDNLEVSGTAWKLKSCGHGFLRMLCHGTRQPLFERLSINMKWGAKYQKK